MTLCSLKIGDCSQMLAILGVRKITQGDLVGYTNEITPHCAANAFIKKPGHTA